ncbi:MAG: hypothetical protein H7Z21_08700 [Hymenobacter sp.]|nr:hypothetical protein [Hymenobacter sp.]
MKKALFFTLTLVGFTSTTLRAQSELRALRLNAIVGTRYNDFDNAFNVAIKPEIYSFTLGAGSTLLRNRFLAGTEFSFSSGTKTSSQQSLQYVGFNTNLFVGYNLLRGAAWRLEPTVGFSLSNNQLIAQEKQNTAFLNLVNNQVGVSTALALINVNSLGLCTGLRVGYYVPFSNDTAWQYRASEADTGLKDNVNAFFVQLTIGGLINLNKK